MKSLKTPIFSASQAFVLYEHFGENLNLPIAKLLNNYEIEGIRGNSGDRYQKLSDIEKVDIATIITKAKNEVAL